MCATLVFPLMLQILLVVILVCPVTVLGLSIPLPPDLMFVVVSSALFSLVVRPLVLFDKPSVWSMTIFVTVHALLPYVQVPCGVVHLLQRRSLIPASASLAMISVLERQVILRDLLLSLGFHNAVVSAEFVQLFACAINLHSVICHSLVLARCSSQAILVAM